MERQSFFHALNQKSVARKAAKEIGKAYEDLNLVVVHLGVEYLLQLTRRQSCRCIQRKGRWFYGYG